MSARWWASPVGIVLAGVPVHLGLAAATDLSPDEAYYAVASRHALDPFRPIVDHPPLICWLLRPTAALSWLPVELQVRLPAVVMSAALALATARLASQQAGLELHPEREANVERIAAFLATWLLLPAAGGFVMTPDVPAALGLLAALAWGGTRKPSGWWAAATSALVGLGCLAKVSVMPAALASFVGACALESTCAGARSYRPARAHRMTKWLWLLGPVAAMPLVGRSLAFQQAHAFVPPCAVSLPAAAAAAFATLASLVALFSPPIVWLGMREVGKIAPVYGTTFGVFGALVMASAAVRGVPAEPNWWLPAALPLVVSGSIAAARLHRKALASVLVLAAAPTLIAMTHAVHPFLPLPARIDPTARLHGWRAGTSGAASMPGVGPYGQAAERCIYQADCSEISLYIKHMTACH